MEILFCLLFCIELIALGIILIVLAPIIFFVHLCWVCLKNSDMIILGAIVPIIVHLWNKIRNHSYCNKSDFHKK